MRRKILGRKIFRPYEFDDAMNMPVRIKFIIQPCFRTVRGIHVGTKNFSP
jgi:hypothetical protein